MKARVWNMISLGRLLAVGTLVAGVVLAVIDTRSRDMAYGISHYQLRSFLAESLLYAWYGGTLLAIAEIASRFDAVPKIGRLDWNLVGLVKAIGLLVLVGGIGLAAWGARSGPTGFFFFSSNSVYAGTKRAAAHNVLEYGWHGLLLILAGEIAERIGWQNVVEDEPLGEPALPLTSGSQP